MTTRDSCHTWIHLKSSRLADLFEEFSRPPLPPSEPILIPPHLQPPNPEDEDDVVPDQHAAFGIQRATQPRREPAWRDLGLEDLVIGERPRDGLDMGGVRGHHGAQAGASPGQGETAPAQTERSEGIVSHPGLGRGAGWTRNGEVATGVGVGVRTLPR